MSDLKVADRCDRCGAQAYYRATLNDSELLFCAHHGRENSDALFLAGWEVDNQSKRLEAAEKVSV
jgi:ribosomal protein L37E